MRSRRGSLRCPPLRSDARLEPLRRGAATFQRVAVQTERAGADGGDVRQPARDGQVLREVNELVRVSEGAMEEERGRDGERRKDSGHQARPEADSSNAPAPISITTVMA